MTEIRVLPIIGSVSPPLGDRSSTEVCDRRLVRTRGGNVVIQLNVQGVHGVTRWAVHGPGDVRRGRGQRRPTGLVLFREGGGQDPQV